MALREITPVRTGGEPVAGIHITGLDQNLGIYVQDYRRPIRQSRCVIRADVCRARRPFRHRCGLAAHRYGGQSRARRRAIFTLVGAAGMLAGAAVTLSRLNAPLGAS